MEEENDINGVRINDRRFSYRSDNKEDYTEDNDE